MNDGLALLSYCLIISALILGGSIYAASENVDIDIIYKLNGHKLEEGK